MDTLFPILVSALTLGSVYALMSVGLALIWGGMNVLNLAQGALFMVGAYAAYTISRWGGGPWIGLAFGALFTGAVGLLIYLGPLRPLLRRRDSGNSVLIATVSITAILENSALAYFGPRNKVVPELAEGSFRLFDVPVTLNATLIMVVAIVLLMGLGAVLRWSRIGIAIRAVAQNAEGAQLSGINPHVLFALVFAMSSALAGVGGVLLGSIYFVTPYVGQTYLLTALIVTILGGLGSVAGTFAAAFAVGFIEAFVAYYLGVRWSLPVLFVTIISVLLFMPAGLAGVASSRRL